MNREERVRKVLQIMLRSGIIIAALTVLISMLMDRTGPQTGTHGFLHGVTVGIRTAFPFMLFFWAYRVYLTNDEYGRIRLLKAAALAFVVVMLVTMAWYPLQQAGKLPMLPVWTGWALGTLTFIVSMGVQSRT
ncbi:hypothetical protein [Deinococcus roseus]|uniref:Uncharacterized protein n=1 Tax=Deinococcus roseus TaxID=392414 RepID=A0ABQ2CXE1_9DEIO|nr:hypothetical protein [Deinococcus roseus]GGJ19275.1 hypothetical protein GCM10008938_01710 [Deinococcus roseus]